MQQCVAVGLGSWARSSSSGRLGPPRDAAARRAHAPAGREQEQLAMSAGFAKAVHYEIGFGFMGVLVVTKRK